VQLSRRGGAQTRQRGGLELDHPWLVDLEHRHIGGPRQPVGPRVETGRQNHRLADAGLGRVEEERVEIASAGGHRVGHVLQPLRGLAVVEFTGVEFTGGPPGEEIDSDRTNLRRQV
jgi:hypothetical protein